MKTSRKGVDKMCATVAILACILLPVSAIAAESSVNEQMLQAAENGSLEQVKAVLAKGAEVPLSFIGTYQGSSRACMTSIIVLRRENISWDECKSKDVPYTVVEADEEHVLLELQSSDCYLPVIRLEGSKLDDANAVQEGLRVSAFRTRSEALAENLGLDCHYGRVDPALGEDQTANFLRSKSATEREKALEVINQQGHSERDKYNEIGLRDPSPAVRAKAASFLNSVPLLIKAMAHDPDPKVRASAGGSLANLYRDFDYGSDGASDEDNPSGGDNDSGGAISITPLEENLDDLLIGLKRLATLRSVLNILGGEDDYGESVVCRMSAKSQEKALNALKHQLETIKLVKEVSWALHPGKPPRWSEAGQDIPRAIEKISKCHPSTQSNRPPETTSAPDDKKEEQRTRQPVDHRKKPCEFAGLALPENYAIFAAGEYSGRETDFQIDQSGHQATQMDVTVNYSSKPVVLALGAYEPTIWNIKWSATTHIVAVLVSGYHRQVVAGLDATVPVLNSSSADRGPCPCGYFYVGQRENSDKINQISRTLFGRPVDLVYPAKNGDVVIGDPVPAGVKLITSESNPPESFLDTTAPIAGPAGLEDAVRKGLLRKATEADADAWVDAVDAYGPDRDVPLIAGKGRPKPPRPHTWDAYVVLKPFSYPAGLYGGHLANLFIPEGVPQPKGEPGHSFVYNFNHLKAYKKALEELGEDQEELSEDQTKEGCEFAGLALPESIAVFAAGNYYGRKIGFQIDQSGQEATRMDVIVNYPSKPVALMLGTTRPTVWNIKWTANTRIAAVFVSGYHRQAIAGLDAAVPVLNSSSENKGPCGHAIVVEEESALLQLNPMSRRLFGRPVDLVYLAKNGKAVVGDPVPAGEKLITSESNPPESFYDKTAPRAGRAGLKDAVRKGLLRKATDADADAWVNAEIANAPKTDPRIPGQARAMPRRPGIHNTYVVLKPFTFPAGLDSDPAAFFIPKGVPRPKGNPGPLRVLDFNEFKIEPPQPSPQTQESKRASAGNIHAASFDCSKATSEVEKLICGDAELSKLDETLIMTYQRVLDRTRKKEEMIESQNQWLENERNECQDAQCIKKAYEIRIKELGLSSYGIVIFRPPIRSTPYSEVNNKLLKAAKKGAPEEVKTLLEEGADVNAKDEDGFTVLMYAALSGNLQLVKHLVNRGADVNARDKDGKTALMFVAAKGDLEAVRFLLDSGADVHAEAANGNTALQLAEEEDNREIVMLLKSHGAEE